MTLPTLTAEQRAEALAKAAAARGARRQLLVELKQGRISLQDVLDRTGQDPVVSRTKVTALVKALPGVGDTRAAAIIAEVQIAENRRVGGLGDRQRTALLAAVAGAAN